jgi:hypothetical protein
VIRRLLSALHEALRDALDVAKLARTVRTLSKRLELMTALADEQRARAEHAERERQWAADRLAAVRRERDEAVAALELRDAGAEIRRARAN